ncbi:MAG: hypothetical protein FWG67_03925 [Defluviitaleaceae bacterium]|nr:hypothetical protein [Defluviitaleaceae bacterium]
MFILTLLTYIDRTRKK